MKHRSRGRELALKYLFSIDTGVEYSLEHFDLVAQDQEEDAQARAFAKYLVSGTLGHRGELVGLIDRSSKSINWNRMSLIDRNLLLLGAHELLYCPETPHQVVLNEIVELGKSYGTVATGAFVNAVLDTIRRERAVLPPAKE